MYQVWHNGGRGVHGINDNICLPCNRHSSWSQDVYEVVYLLISLASPVHTNKTHRVLVSKTMHITWLQYIEHLLYLGLTFGFGRIRLNHILNYTTNKGNSTYWTLSNLTETENYNSQWQMIKLRFRKFKWYIHVYIVGEWENWGLHVVPPTSKKCCNVDKAHQSKDTGRVWLSWFLPLKPYTLKAFFIRTNYSVADQQYLRNYSTLLASIMSLVTK